MPGAKEVKFADRYYTGSVQRDKGITPVIFVRSQSKTQAFGWVVLDNNRRSLAKCTTAVHVVHALSLSHTHTHARMHARARARTHTNSLPREKTVQHMTHPPRPSKPKVNCITFGTLNQALGGIHQNKYYIRSVFGTCIISSLARSLAVKRGRHLHLFVFTHR